jgi:hypothetical protein
VNASLDAAKECSVSKYLPLRGLWRSGIRVSKQKCHVPFNHLSRPYVGSQRDDRDKGYRNILESVAGVARGIITVYDDIHNVQVGCPHGTIVVAITVAIQELPLSQKQVTPRTATAWLAKPISRWSGFPAALAMFTAVRSVKKDVANKADGEENRCLSLERTAETPLLRGVSSGVLC